MKYKQWTAILVLVFAQPSWSQQPVPMNLTEDAMAVAKDGNEFATDLYARLHSDSPGNLFFSPYSISVALAMTDAGAAGETETQMAKVLHFQLSETKVHPAYGACKNSWFPTTRLPIFSCG